MNSKAARVKGALEDDLLIAEARRCCLDPRRVPSLSALANPDAVLIAEAKACIRDKHRVPGLRGPSANAVLFAESARFFAARNRRRVEPPSDTPSDHPETYPANVLSLSLEGNRLQKLDWRLDPAWSAFGSAMRSDGEATTRRLAQPAPVAPKPRAWGSYARLAEELDRKDKERRDEQMKRYQALTGTHVPLAVVAGPTRF